MSTAIGTALAVIRAALIVSTSLMTCAKSTGGLRTFPRMHFHCNPKSGMTIVPFIVDSDREFGGGGRRCGGNVNKNGVGIDFHIPSF